MPAKANKRPPTAFWAAAIAVLTPNALAGAAEAATPDTGANAQNVLKASVSPKSWKIVVDAVAREQGSGLALNAVMVGAQGAPIEIALSASSPGEAYSAAGQVYDAFGAADPTAHFFERISSSGFQPPAKVWVDATRYALAVRYGAPLATQAAAPAEDPLWVEAAATPADPQSAVATAEVEAGDAEEPALGVFDAGIIVADASAATSASGVAQRDTTVVDLAASADPPSAFAGMVSAQDAPVVLTPVEATAEGDASDPSESVDGMGRALDAPVVLRAARAEADAASAAPEFVQEIASEAAQASALAPLTLRAVNANEGPLVALDAAADDAGAADPSPPAPIDPPGSRRRPGSKRGEATLIPVPDAIATDPGAVAPATYRDIEPCEATAGGVDPTQNARCAPPIPDRWRLIENLGLVKERWWDPFNQNTLKGDRPVFGTKDWFVILNGISDTIVEPRSFPIPVGVQTTSRRDNNDLFGDPDALVLAQTFIVSVAAVQGSTAFKPQDQEFRLALAWNVNYAEVEEKRILNVRPDAGLTRNDSFIGLQEAFYEKHLRNVSERYDFDSLRVGIQPFSSDFRGFLFQDNQLGVRFFGTRNNNRFQYNLAGFWRLEKDTNSGLNDAGVEPRKDFVFLANAYRQDTPIPGFTSQLTAVYNVNREAGDIHVDKNGFPARPALIGDLRTRDYDVGYIGYNGDGHLGRVNLTASAYYAFGKDKNNVFTGKESVIRSYFVALEPSIDFDWIRVRGSALIGSGDDNPYDDRQEGFDAIFENPQFAGADTSYWIRQSVPFIGGGRAIGLSGRNGILNSLRSSKEEGQSNFVNPGIKLLGVGADFDVLPELRISASANHLSFDKTEVLEALRVEGSIPKEIGWDVSAAATYRPGFIQNFVFRLSAAALAPGDGFKDLFSSNDKRDYFYSVLFNATLSY